MGVRVLFCLSVGGRSILQKVSGDIPGKRRVVFIVFHARQSGDTSCGQLESDPFHISDPVETSAFHGVDNSPVSGKRGEKIFGSVFAGDDRHTGREFFCLFFLLPGSALDAYRE